jgi:hypothetical protein
MYAISAWDLQCDDETKQGGLIITPDDQPTITIETLEMAEFISLLLKNKHLRDVINILTSKVVLILGRFSDERKPVLDALRDELRKHDYQPVVFDFEKAAGRDLRETISTLARLARFIIVDPTDPSSTPHEMATVIPQTIVPVQPLMLDGERAYSMFRDLRQRYHWVLPTYSYTDLAHLLATLQASVIEPAEQKAKELEKKR